MADVTRPRLWRYEVDEVKGDVSIEIGSVIVDKWKADRTWTVYNFSQAGDPFVGYWHAKLLGEAPPDVAQQVYARWDREREVKLRAAKKAAAK